MRVGYIVRKILRPCLDVVHAARFAALCAVVEAVIRARRASIAAMGRSLEGGTAPKHGIKRVDRLLSNGRLHLERAEYFKAIAAYLLRKIRRPLIIVDWTQAAGDLQALVAAVPIGGRAVPIYEEVHPLRKLGNARVQSRFLGVLQRVLPQGTNPIVVTDAGFHGPFFRAVLALGWDFVGRVRGTATARSADGTKFTKKELYRRASPIPRDLGWFRLYSWREGVDARLVVVRSRRKPGRRRKSRSQDEAAIRRAARDPWLLATSLATGNAEQIVSIYSRRMQIEEAFRDAKNHRFGWSFRHVTTDSPQRLDALLLVVILGMLVASQVGRAMELSGKHRAYQANTASKRVLSFFVLGVAAIYRRERLPPSALTAALQKMRFATTTANSR
jgi:hypothetical protein